MKSLCVLCGKPTEPAAFIGGYAVGPKCAQRAGLTAKKLPKGSKVRIVKGGKQPKPKMPENLDLFEDIPCNSQ